MIGREDQAGVGVRPWVMLHVPLLDVDSSHSRRRLIKPTMCDHLWRALKKTSWHDPRD
jgi:hypothetical protein